MLHHRTYQINNEIPWVTLIHGAGANSASWYKQLKEYKKHFNVLLIDLRGHGKSERNLWNDGDTFEQIADEVVEVLDHLGIERTHFVGISLGTIVIQTISNMYPNRVQSMVLGGAVTYLDFRTQFLIRIGDICKRILPYMWIYSLFAWIIMPRKNNKEARKTFVAQAKKMCQKEFIKWFSLTRGINPFLVFLQKDFHSIPTLFMMGDGDYLFLKWVHKIAEREPSVNVRTISEAGHVCNIDQPERFNESSIQFLLKNSRCNHRLQESV